MGVLGPDQSNLDCKIVKTYCQETADKALARKNASMEVRQLEQAGVPQSPAQLSAARRLNHKAPRCSDGSDASMQDGGQ